MRIKNATELKTRNVNLEESFMNLHERKSTVKNENLAEVYKILDKYGRVDEDVDKVFRRATLIEQRKMVELLESGNTAPTNYVIVVDYSPRDQYLENQTLLGWDNDTDWFDHYTYGDEIITPAGRIKRNSHGLIFVGNVGVYVGESQSDVQSYSDDGNEEGYDCTVCKIEKDNNGDWIVVPV